MAGWHLGLYCSQMSWGALSLGTMCCCSWTCWVFSQPDSNCSGPWTHPIHLPLAAKSLPCPIPDFPTKDICSSPGVFPWEEMGIKSIQKTIPLSIHPAPNNSQCDWIQPGQVLTSYSGVFWFVSLFNPFLRNGKPRCPSSTSPNSSGFH